jgi:hypothetical protein
LKVVGQYAIEARTLARRAEKGRFPEGGGTNDQTASVMDAIEVYEEMEAQLKPRE